MQESAVPAYITSLPFCGSSGRYTRRLRKSKGQGSPLREGSAAPGSHRPPGSHRNEHELVARHRAAHGDRTTTHGGRRPERILGFELARTAGSSSQSCCKRILGGFHHPHLRGTMVHGWPLNVFCDEDAAAQLPILRAIASSDLHNL